VRAVTLGRVLVVDEADKAPLEVVVLLKALLEDGEVLLADGRRILSAPRIAQEALTTGPQDATEVKPAHRNRYLSLFSSLFLSNTIHNCYRKHRVKNSSSCHNAYWFQLIALFIFLKTQPKKVPPGVIPVHPNFAMWVLANRPGFPFLGNNFFGAAGDAFAVHVLHNPDAGGP
jgi:hypothetical protein